MAEWWTYRLSDFLLFSARTYYRLFELYNTEVWPLHLLALAFGAGLVFAAWRRSMRAACVMLAACWLWVAWAFHLQRFATINWAATGYAVAFFIEGVLLLGCAWHAGLPADRGWRTRVGWGLLLFALLGQPVIGLLLGRLWRQAEVFGLAPDPTTVATLGCLLLMPTRAALAWLLWPIPLVWCLVSGATLWTLHATDAWLMPGVALLAAVAGRPAQRSR